MDFRALCQMAARESGVVSGTQPSSVVNQTGLLLRIVTWTADAVEWVENADMAWRWMRKGWTGALTANNRAYTAGSFGLTDFSAWVLDDIERKLFPTSLYLTATGVSDEQKLHFLAYDAWRDRFDTGTQETGRPGRYTVSDANEIVFAQTPDDAYTARGLYRRAPVRPTINTSTPAWPAQFHAVAAWESARRLAAYDKAWDEARRCESERDEIMGQMRTDQLPPLRIRRTKLA